MFVARGDASGLAPDAASLVAGPSYFRPLFASLGFGMGGSTAAPVTDKRTGVQFPGEFCLRSGSSNCPRITGTGVRGKRLAGIKNIDVYALALYVDSSAAHGALHARFQEEDPEALRGNQRLFDELVAADGVEKTLRLVITSKLVNRSKFLDALKDRLAPPLEAAGAGGLLSEFTAQFEGAEFRKGLVISFTADQGRLVTKVDGAEVGTIGSKTLTHTLFGIYLGRDPVSPDAKDAFGSGLAGMVLA